MNNTKKILSSVMALSLAASYALASVSLSPDSELFVTAKAGASYNDNIFLNSNGATSDTIWDLTPGLLVSFGQGSQFAGQISAAEDFQEYSTYSSLNHDLAAFDFSSKYDDGVTKFNVLAWYHQADQATRDIRNTTSLVLRDLAHVEVVGENSLTQKTSIGAGVQYDDVQYKASGYANYNWYAIPVNYYYEVAPKLDIDLGFKYKDNTVGSGANDSQEYFYSVGARGELAPKLTGQFSIGYDQEHLKNIGTVDQVGLDSSFTYQADEKTSVLFGLKNNFGYDASGAALKDAGGNIGVSEEINDAVVVTGSLSYDRFGYSTQNRTDDFYQGQLAGTYKINKMLSVTLAYAYVNNSSTVASDSFKSNVFSILASFKY